MSYMSVDIFKQSMHHVSTPVTTHCFDIISCTDVASTTRRKIAEIVMALAGDLPQTKAIEGFAISFLGSAYYHHCYSCCVGADVNMATAIDIVVGAVVGTDYSFYPGTVVVVRNSENTVL